MDYIINLFTKEHGYYSKYLQFQVIVIFIIIIVCFTKLPSIKDHILTIIGLIIFGIYICNNYLKIINNDILDENKLTYLKLETLQEKVYEYIQYNIKHKSLGIQILSSKKQQELFTKNKLNAFYIDSSLINFIYSILPLYEYNKDEFYLFLKGTNNILKLQKEIEDYYDSNKNYQENISEMLEIATQLKINCINNLHNFIYSIPKTKIMYNYIDSILNTYMLIINKHINQITLYQNNYNKKNGINNMTKFVYPNMPKGFDIEFNHSVIPNKNINSKLIDLYI